MAAKRTGAIGLLGSFFLVACSANPAATATIGPTVTLLPYATASATATAAGIEESAALPTPTPELYTVKQGDTMFDIAALHGLTVEQLQAANPGVDPRLLSPGTELVIPAAGGGGTAVPLIPSPTPVAVQATGVTCYGTAIGELWCFLLAANANAFPVENVIGVIQLLDASGEVIETYSATPPLDLLLQGQSMPLVAYLDEAPAGWAAARGQIISAFELPPDDDYYLDADLSSTDIDIAEDSRSARVQGEVQIAGEQEPDVLWVLAVAYDADGKVAGFSKWESEGARDFSFYVYSVGAEIDRVELLVEAR